MKNEAVFYCTYCNTLQWFEEIETDFWVCKICDHEKMKVINKLSTGYEQVINKLSTPSNTDVMRQKGKSDRVINNTS